MVAGVPGLLGVTAIATDWNADRAESHFQLWWKMARKETKDVGWLVHSKAMTPQSVRLAPELQTVSALAYFH